MVKSFQNKQSVTKPASRAASSVSKTGFGLKFGKNTLFRTGNRMTVVPSTATAASGQNQMSKLNNHAVKILFEPDALIINTQNQTSGYGGGFQFILVLAKVDDLRNLPKLDSFLNSDLLYPLNPDDIKLCDNEPEFTDVLIALLKANGNYSKLLVDLKKNQKKYGYIFLSKIINADGVKYISGNHETVQQFNDYLLKRGISTTGGTKRSSPYKKRKTIKKRSKR